MAEYDNSRIKNIKFLLKERKYNIAEKEALKYLEDYPENPYGMFYYGMALKKNYRLEEAFEVFQEVVKQRASNQFTALYEMGRIESRRNRIPEAKYYFNKVLKESPNSEIFSAIELSKLEKRLGNIDQAEQILRKAAQDKTSNNQSYAILELAKLLLLRNKKTEASVLVNSIPISQNDKGNRKVAYMKGRIEVCYRNYEGALEHYNQAAGDKKDELYWSSILEIAKVYESQGEIEKAYRTALRIKDNRDTNLVDVHMLLGKILKQKGRIEEARAAFKEVLEKPSFSKEALFRLGILEVEQQNKIEAENYFREVIQTVELYTVPAYFGLINLKLSQGEEEDCRNYIEEVKQLELNEDMRRSLKEIEFYLDVRYQQKIPEGELTYKQQQIVDYQEERVLEHIKQQQQEDSMTKFNENIDIDTLFYGVKEHLKEASKKSDSWMDCYILNFPNIGIEKENPVDLLKVVCLPNTYDIITMFPYVHGKKAEETSELVSEQYKVKEKKKPRLSQIDKFNARYGKK